MKILATIVSIIGFLNLAECQSWDEQLLYGKWKTNKELTVGSVSLDSQAQFDSLPTEEQNQILAQFEENELSLYPDGRVVLEAGTGEIYKGSWYQDGDNLITAYSGSAPISSELFGVTANQLIFRLSDPIGGFFQYLYVDLVERF